MRYFNAHECTFRYSVLAAYEVMPTPFHNLTPVEDTDPLSHIHSPHLRAKRWQQAALQCLKSPLLKIGFLNTMPVPVFGEGLHAPYISDFRVITLEDHGMIGVQDFTVEAPAPGYCGDVWNNRVVEVLHHQEEQQWTLITAEGRAAYVDVSQPLIADVRWMITPWYETTDYWSVSHNVTAWVLPLFEFQAAPNYN